MLAESEAKMKLMLFWFLIPIPFFFFQIAFDFSKCANYRGDKGKGLVFALITWTLFLFGTCFGFYIFSEWPIWAKILSCFAAYGFGRVIFKVVFKSLNEKTKKAR